MFKTAEGIHNAASKKHSAPGPDSQASLRFKPSKKMTDAANEINEERGIGTKRSLPSSSRSPESGPAHLPKHVHTGSGSASSTARMPKMLGGVNILGRNSSPKPTLNPQPQSQPRSQSQSGSSTSGLLQTTKEMSISAYTPTQPPSSDQQSRSYDPNIYESFTGVLRTVSPAPSPMQQPPSSYQRHQGSGSEHHEPHARGRTDARHPSSQQPGGSAGYPYGRTSGPHAQGQTQQRQGAEARECGPSDRTRWTSPSPGAFDPRTYVNPPMPGSMDNTHLESIPERGRLGRRVQEARQNSGSPNPVPQDRDSPMDYQFQSWHPDPEAQRPRHQKNQSQVEPQAPPRSAFQPSPPAQGTRPPNPAPTRDQQGSDLVFVEMKMPGQMFERTSPDRGVWCCACIAAQRPDQVLQIHGGSACTNRNKVSRDKVKIHPCGHVMKGYRRCVRLQHSEGQQMLCKPFRHVLWLKGPWTSWQERYDPVHNSQDGIAMSATKEIRNFIIASSIISTVLISRGQIQDSHPLETGNSSGTGIRHLPVRSVESNRFHTHHQDFNNDAYCQNWMA